LLFAANCDIILVQKQESRREEKTTELHAENFCWILVQSREFLSQIAAILVIFWKPFNGYSFSFSNPLFAGKDALAQN
jgi:hypothetical protein